MSTKLSSNVSQKDEIIYFSDTQDHALYSKDKLLIRMRWRNQWLDVVTKKRDLTKKDIEYIEENYSDIENHHVKYEIDQVSEDNKTKSCALVHFIEWVHQSFPFKQPAIELLTDAQKKFIHHFTDRKIKELYYLIPIKSKSYSITLDHKYFTELSICQWSVPHIYDNKIYEISLKTLSYHEWTINAFKDYIKSLDIEINSNWIFKTNRVYETYFGIDT